MQIKHNNTFLIKLFDIEKNVKRDSIACIKYCIDSFLQTKVLSTQMEKTDILIIPGLPTITLNPIYYMATQGVICLFSVCLLSEQKKCINSVMKLLFS